MREERDAGFGLVEALIALTLLALIVMAAAPVMVSALGLTSQSSVAATASDLANGQLERARSAATTCPAFKSFLSAPLPATYTDARGVTYTLSQTPASSVSCPAAGESLLDYKVSVTTSQPGTQPAVTVVTQIWMVN